MIRSVSLVRFIILGLFLHRLARSSALSNLENFSLALQVSKISLNFVYANNSIMLHIGRYSFKKKVVSPLQEIMTTDNMKFFFCKELSRTDNMRLLSPFPHKRSILIHLVTCQLREPKTNINMSENPRLAIKPSKHIILKSNI